ncbi:MAG: gliding motility-associated ABC transporter substrate-binding protein GldG [Weeksellaceae bacterium]|nr:gliding motility-associated ABC transporter substrate-binding protein GldG [Weeksellaceae bacterium]
MQKNSHFIIPVLLLVLLVLSQLFYVRADMTADRRFSFSPSTFAVLESVQEPVQINVFLAGDLTGNFKILRNETQYFLNELQRRNPQINYRFIDPLKEELRIDSLRSIGVMDVSVPTEDKILRVFPYATLTTDERSVTLPLLSDRKIPIDDRALVSVELLESTFIKELHRLHRDHRMHLGMIVHNDQLLPNYLDGFFRVVSRDYDITPYTRPLQDSVPSLQISDIDSLMQFDALIMAKPLSPLSDTDKLVLDQYLMRDGKILWLMENVDAEMDSLFRSERIVAFPRENATTEMLFSYGMRITPSVVKDLQSGFITLAIGAVGGNTAYEQFPWPYFPIAMPSGQHSITRKIGNPLRFEFANPIEILPREGVEHTVLLTSSPNVQLQKPLTFIQFDEIEHVDINNYPTHEGVYPLAVLAEGELPSAYAGRMQSTQVPNFVAKSQNGKLLLISDGDFIKNHIFRGEALPLGADKYTLRPDMQANASVIYGNGQFLLNALDYLTGNDALIEITSKERRLELLDRNMVRAEKGIWRWINLLIPVGLISLLAGLGIWYRRKRYTTHLKS